MSKVSVVTGGNKGIGYAIVRKLANDFQGITYLTARNAKLGQESLDQVQKEVGAPNNQKIRFHQLDITNKESIVQLREHLQKEFGGLDILINNAGIAYKRNATEPFGEQAQNTLAINYFGTKQTCELLFPLLRPHARLAKSGTHTSQGYPNTAYGMSKAGEIALTLIQSRQMETDPREDIIINGCCPGYVDTDMTSHKGRLTPAQGADTPVYLALLPPNCDDPKGKFVAERKVAEWS